MPVRPRGLRPQARWLVGILLVVAVVAPAVLAAPAAVAASLDVEVADNVFTAPGVAVTPGESVRWTYAAGGTFHNVRFEDGGFSPHPPLPALWSVTRTFPAEGTYRYYCEVHGGPGGQGMAGVVYVNADASLPGHAPSASFVVTPSLARVSQTIVLNASATTDPDDAVNRYEWDVNGDGVYETDRGAQPAASVAYNTPGPRTVGLRVTDGQGHTAVTTRPLNVTHAPIASFSVAPSPAQPGQSVTFDASASVDPDGSITKHEWDLDADGSFETDTASTASASHSYASAGTVVVGLRVTDNLGLSAVTHRTLQVSGPAVAPPVPTAESTAPPDPVASVPAPTPACDTLVGSKRATCMQARCRNLTGARRASCLGKSCRYLAGARRANCIQSSCRYLAKAKRRACGRTSCRFLTGATRRACVRRYASRLSTT